MYVYTYILSGPWKLYGRFRCVSVIHVSVTFPLLFRRVSVDVSIAFPLGNCLPDKYCPKTPAAPTEAMTNTALHKTAVRKTAARKTAAPKAVAARKAAMRRAAVRRAAVRRAAVHKTAARRTSAHNSTLSASSRGKPGVDFEYLRG